MRGIRRRVVPAAVAALFLLFPVSCARVAPPPSPRAAPVLPPAGGRAVLVSFDGVAGERLDRMLEDPAKLPADGFRRLAARGFHAVRATPPTPSLTAVSHITHVTGALPEATGIVANLFRDFSKPFPATISGFAAPIRAETLWQAARRQGRRVGVMLYPGVDGNGPARSADWMMTWPGDPIADGRLHALGADSWKPLAGPAAAGSFSPLRRVVLSFGNSPHSVALVAIDRSDDSRANYDGIRVEPPAGDPREVRAGEWFPVELPNEQGRTGAWCKLMSLTPDLAKTEVYLGPLSRSTGQPREWMRALDERVGFWPGTPDSTAFGARSEHPEVFLEQTARLVDFLTRADLLAIARPDWDLILIYRPEVDEVSHEFLLVDPAQPRFTPERSERLMGLVEKSYALADESLAAIQSALAPSDSIFVTSDHGMTPLHTEIAPNQILFAAGLVRLDAQGKIDASSEAFAVPSSAIANVYANPSASPTAIARAERALRDFRVRGGSPFERIVRREDAGPLGLRAPEAGDLIVLAKPGYIFSSRVRDGANAVGEPRSYGGHGNLNVYPDIDATFFAAGPGIARGRVEKIGLWQIAARVAAALGVEPPRQAARR